MSISVIVSGPFIGTGTETDYPLAVDPGSTANMAVNVSGLTLLIGEYGLVRNEIGAFIRISAVCGVPFEVRTIA